MLTLRGDAAPSLLSTEDIPAWAHAGHATAPPRPTMWAALGPTSGRGRHLRHGSCAAHAEEKVYETPPPGVPGVETMLPLLLTAVHDGRSFGGHCDPLCRRTAAHLRRPRK
ncbi:MAG: hypothetical protein R2873_26295 [Caldilineaceae bacterium]